MGPKKDIIMTKVNDPGKNDDTRDDFRRDDEQNYENNLGFNGIEDDDSSSSENEHMDHDEYENNGYQLLPQEPSQSTEGVNENFADFDQHFHLPQSRVTRTADSTIESSGNPSIQGMIQQARQEQNREEIQERVGIFSTPSTETTDGKSNDNITLDKTKIETIKSSMSSIKLSSEPPKWLKEMSEDEWNNMLKNKIKK